MQRAAKNQQGTVLMLTLIILFVLTVIAISSSHDAILNMKMQGNMQQYGAVFRRAELGLQQTALSIEGESMVLPNSTIVLKTTENTVNTDACGNQTIDLQSTAHNANATVILNSRDIFARVPRVRDCDKIPLHQVVWWKES